MTNFLDEAADFANQIDPHQTSPNPRVACMVVRDTKILSKSVHEKFGGNHAEINALKDLDEDLTGCEIYITLEPCDHFEGKKTQSCTDFLIAKLKDVENVKVIVGALDPKFKGKNIKKIQKAGIDCCYIVNEKCEKLNPFLKNWVESKTPFLRLKMAMSLDGKITNKNKWISNELSREKVHQSRSQFSAILTTTETILRDNPHLNVRLKKAGNKFSNPPLLVFGKREIPSTSKIFSIKNRDLHFFTGENLQKDFEAIKKLNIDSVLTECGSRMATALLKTNLVNEIESFIAPRIFGEGKNSFESKFNISSDFTLKSTENLEGDLKMKFVKK